MSLNASDVLGSPEVAGVKVNPRGLGKAIMGGGINSGAGGGLAGIAVKAVADTVIQKKLQDASANERAAAARSHTPTFPKIAWLAVTAQELALVEVDARSTLKLTGVVLSRVPRPAVRSIEVARSKLLIAAPVTVTFADGQQWIFEVPAGNKGRAKALAANFG